MDSPPKPLAPDNATILILKADRVYAEALRAITHKAFPGSTARVVATVHAAAQALKSEPVDLLVTGMGTSLDGDVLDLLSQCVVAPREAKHVLVVSGCHDYRLLAALRTLGVEGVFDTTSDTSDELIVALHSVLAGTHYWSRSVVEHLKVNSCESNAVFRLLTPFEQVVLCVVGDGSDDLVAANQLGLSPATVSTVRRELHRKLGVQHRGELVRMAAQNGFVRFTPAGVVRPGFTILTASYRPRRRADKATNA